MHVKRGDQVSRSPVTTRDRPVRSSRSCGPRTAWWWGVNVRVKHEKPTQQSPQGERVRAEFPIHASNVQLIDPATGKGNAQAPAGGLIAPQHTPPRQLNGPTTTGSETMAALTPRKVRQRGPRKSSEAFDIKNATPSPSLEKIVVNMGL